MYKLQATVDDGTCDSNSNNTWLTFRGYYQTCKVIEEIGNHTISTPCLGIESRNLLTQDFTCQGSDIPSYNISDTGFYITSHNKGETGYVKINVSPNTCMGGPDDDTRALFAGIYETDNFWSGHQGCPYGYTEVPFLYDFKFCYAKFKETLVPKSVEFFGILDAKYQECIKGMSKYYFTTIDGQKYSYCSTIFNGKTIFPPQLSTPPYVD